MVSDGFSISGDQRRNSWNFGGTCHVWSCAYQVLDYLATHPKATVHFRTLDMVMNIHSDALYLNRKHEAEHGDIFSWAQYQKMEIPSN